MPGLTIDKKHTAVLIMDLQREIIERNAMASKRNIVAKIKEVLAASRKARITVIYVVIEFREGYPEIPPNSRVWVGIKERGSLKSGSPGAEIPAEIAPQKGEPIVVRRRVNAFFNTELDMLLRAKGIATLVIMGIATGGVVLPSVLHAADADYESIVLEDCCADSSEERHTFLCNNVLAGRATVATAQDFIGAII